MALTVLVMVPNSLGVAALSEMLRLSRLSWDEVRERDGCSDPLLGSWNRRTLESDSAK